MTTMFYNDVRAGTDPLMMFISFNIYAMNVLAFLTYAAICDFIVANPLLFQDVYIIKQLCE
jgi:hypothetical protein